MGFSLHHRSRVSKCVKHTFLPSALGLGIAGWPGSNSSSMKIAFDQFASTCIKHCQLVTLQMHLFDVLLFIIDLLRGTKCA